MEVVWKGGGIEVKIPAKRTRTQGRCKERLGRIRTEHGVSYWNKRVRKGSEYATTYDSRHKTSIDQPLGVENTCDMNNSTRSNGRMQSN